ncbi:site-specific integrase [Ruegeria atlantica]|uniref:Site-specific tyrosine recombinase XerD n=1 Tax=Ruegeria atlantica TaxID=81569 RepID=A0A0P1E6R0_9RHOB|nr:site-specific integrase [Ruegeria atlantica]CUH44495.1 site-specific tyrosine recombinase XerD [Ruegeria atlantica]
MSLARRSPMEVKQPDWPASDQMAWDTLFVEGDILDGQGPLAHWRQTTRQKCAQSYGYWLAFVARTDGLGETTNPADRVNPDTVKAFVQDTLGRCSTETTHMRLNELGKIVRAMSRTTDWAWLRNVENRLRKQCRHGEIKRRAGITALDLYNWGLDRMNEADANQTLSPKNRAIQFRQGLIVALLVARPLRKRTFLGLRIGKGLVETNGNYVLSLDREDLKDNKARDFPLPSGLKGKMARYLSHHRKILLQDATSDALWISKYGGAYTTSGFVGSLAKLTFREFGETLRPHAFRHIAATSVALDDPENVNIIATILGHASLSTSEAYYNRAQGIEAINAYQDVVRDLRKSADRQKPQAGARRPRLKWKETA